MNNKAKLYMTKLSSELSKEAGRGDMVFKLLGKATNAYSKTPKSFFSPSLGKIVDLRGTLDKITGTSGTLKDMIRSSGIIPKDTNFSRSLQSDYARLLRGRLNELNEIVSPQLSPQLN